MPIDHAQRIAAAIPNSEFLDADTDMYPFLGPDLAHNLQILAGFLGPAAAAQPPAVKQPNRSAGLDLSGRELQVLALIAAGRSNQEVADELGVSVSTVDRHVANIYAKVNVHNRAEATLWAVAHSIVTPPAT